MPWIAACGKNVDKKSPSRPSIGKPFRMKLGKGDGLLAMGREQQKKKAALFRKIPAINMNPHIFPVYFARRKHFFGLSSAVLHKKPPRLWRKDNRIRAVEKMWITCVQKNHSVDASQKMRPLFLRLRSIPVCPGRTNVFGCGNFSGERVGAGGLRSGDGIRNPLP